MLKAKTQCPYLLRTVFPCKDFKILRHPMHKKQMPFYCQLTRFYQHCQAKNLRTSNPLKPALVTVLYHQLYTLDASETVSPKLRYPPRRQFLPPTSKQTDISLKSTLLAHSPRITTVLTEVLPRGDGRHPASQFCAHSLW